MAYNGCSLTAGLFVSLMLGQLLPSLPFLLPVHKLLRLAVSDIVEEAEVGLPANMLWFWGGGMVGVTSNKGVQHTVGLKVSGAHIKLYNYKSLYTPLHVL